MTTRVVHRPTRTTVPVVRPQPQPLAPPPSLETDQASGPMPLQMLLPVMGATSSVVMMVVMRNGQPQYLVVAGLVFVVALVGGLGVALSAKGRAGRTERIRRRKYLDYLEHLRRDLATRGTDDRSQVGVAHPDPGALVGLVADPTRLWERRRADEDYLTTRVGVGAVDWFDLSVPPPESPVAPHDPYLLAEANLVVAQHSTVAGMPVTVDLAQASVVAVIGPRDAAVALVRAMVAQLACHHGPDDLVLAGWFGPEHAADWAGLDLLPHVEDSTLFDGPVPARRVGRDPSELRHVLGTALADRVSYAHAARRTSTPLPAPSRLVVVGDDWGVPARRAVSGVDVSPAAMGVTVVHVLADRLDEPDDVDVRIELAADPSSTATITTAPGRAGQHTVVATPDLMDSALFVATARSLAPLRLSAAASAPGEETVPDTDELLDFTDPAHLAHWDPREPEDFLRVPFAHDDHGDPVWLDLKESAQLGMGPHGLCVGATGSGKSEMLRTLVVSLVTTHPPEDLAMILVDYKGGAAFAPFAGLPHLAGLIDNLADDPHLTTRARASISGEVVRRQRMLKDAGSLPSIGAYRAARETDPDLPPMPHLLVVIDEFGELLTAEPEFSDLFLQIGRIGRSIGVHLLLASQRLESGKLRGLDTYLSYRLGLRTFSEAESQMVLDSSDAYRLPALPGYGYLKVDTSVYTRFRAGYVSGPMHHAAGPPPEATTMRAALMGPYNGLQRGDHASRSDRPVELRRADTGPSVVDTVVAQLRDPERGVAPVQEVWLPPLPDRLAVGSLVDVEPPAGSRSDLSAVMGLVDDPAAQRQGPWWLDLTRSGGHVAFVGAPGSGRTTALRTLAVSLALTRTPSEVAVYGLDLTGGGLARLEGFPHVGGVASRTDQDKVVRLLEELGSMLQLRERLVRTHQVESMAHLRSLHRAGRLPGLAAADVVVLVDGYGQLRTDFPQLDDQFAALLTRGPSFGLHLVMGMNRWSDLRMAHQTLVGTRVELRLGDPGDSTVDRKLAKTLSPDTPGRVLTDDSRFAQVALPVLELVDDDQVGEALEALAARSSSAWTGPSAAPIRLLPTELPLAALPDAFDAPDAVPLGLRQDTMDTAWWDLLGDDQHLLVLGDTRCGKTTLLRTVVAGLTARWTPDEVTLAVVDPRGHVGPAVPEDYLAAHATTAQQAAAMVRSIVAELDQRPGRDAATRAREPRVVVLVDDHDIIAAGGTDPLEGLLPYLPSARDLRLHLVVTRPVAGAGRALFGPTLSATRDTGGATLVMSGDRSEGALVGRTHAEHLPPGRGRYVRRGVPPFLVQVAWAPVQTREGGGV